MKAPCILAFALFAANLRAASVERGGVLLSIHRLDEARYEVLVKNTSDEDVWIWDTIFDPVAFPKFALGVTVFFRSSEGIVMGVVFHPLRNRYRAYSDQARL